MNEQDFTIVLELDATPEAVFAAINDVRAWWTGEIEGETDQFGAEFTYRYRDMHWSRQKLTELVPARRVVWHVADARINFVHDKREWNGTDIIFDIAPAGSKTELRFTHRGLVPRMECYEDCSGGWNFYIAGSLRDLIATGAGRPDPEAQPISSVAR